MSRCLAFILEFKKNQIFYFYFLFLLVRHIKQVFGQAPVILIGDHCRYIVENYI